MVPRPTPSEAKRPQEISAGTNVPRCSVILVSLSLSRGATHCQLPTARPLAHWAAGDLPPVLRAHEASYSCVLGLVFLAKIGEKGRIEVGMVRGGDGKKTDGVRAPRALGGGLPGLAFSCKGFLPSLPPSPPPGQHTANPNSLRGLNRRWLLREAHNRGSLFNLFPPPPIPVLRGF